MNVKDRYGDRGSLVIPEAGSRELMDPEGSSWWLACLRTFSGARLVEVAVLLHSLGDGISDVQVSEDGEAVTILAQAQRGAGGTTALVVSTRVDGSVSPVVSDAIIEKASGHHDMVMALHTHDEAFDLFVENLTEDLARRGLTNANMPIAASLNRCYVDKDLAAARPLI